MGDLFSRVDVKAFTVGEAVGVGLQLAWGILGGVDRYCIYEGDDELVIEFWRGGGLVKCVEY